VVSVIVFGGRDFNRFETVDAVLQQHRSRYGLDTVVTGEWAGAEALAREWARREGVELVVVKDDRDKHGASASQVRYLNTIDRFRFSSVYLFEGGRTQDGLVESCVRHGTDLRIVRSLTGRGFYLHRPGSTGSLRTPRRIQAKMLQGS